MRVAETPFGTRVEYDEDDTDSFSAMWPCSRVAGEGWFEFDREWNLVDLSDSAGEGKWWVAFCDDCREFAKAKIDVGERYDDPVPMSSRLGE